MNKERLVERVLDYLEKNGESTAEDVADSLGASVVDVYHALKAAYDDSKVVRRATEFYTTDDEIEWDVLTWVPLDSYLAREGGRRAISARSGAVC